MIIYQDNSLFLWVDLLSNNFDSFDSDKNVWFLLKPQVLHSEDSWKSQHQINLWFHKPHPLLIHLAQVNLACLKVAAGFILLWLGCWTSTEAELRRPVCIQGRGFRNYFTFRNLIAFKSRAYRVHLLQVMWPCHVIMSREQIMWTNHVIMSWKGQLNMTRLGHVTCHVID